MGNFFMKCNDCEKEITHLCKEDSLYEHVMKYRDHILKIPISNNNHGSLSKNPRMAMCTHSYEDFEKVIIKISSDSACGSDGISVTLLKRLVKPV